jgi:hypothetical protein
VPGVGLLREVYQPRVLHAAPAFAARKHAQGRGNLSLIEPTKLAAILPAWRRNRNRQR